MRPRLVIPLVAGAALAIVLALVLVSRTVIRRGGETGPVEVEVRPRRATRLGQSTGPRLDDEAVAALRRRPQVLAVVPRLELTGPAAAHVDVGGEAIRFEAGGFTDGIPVAAVAGEPLAGRFVDLDPAAPPGPACRPEDGARACADHARWYCDPGALRCEPRVPVIVSPTMVELYDTQLAREQGLPAARTLGLVAGAVTDGPTFTIVLGEAMVRPADPGAARPPRRLIGAVLIGVSPQARMVGMTAPLGHVRAWNRALTTDPAALAYASATVRLRAAADRAAFTAAAEALGLTVGAPP